MARVVKLDAELIPKIRWVLLRDKLAKEVEPTNPYEAFRLKYADETLVAYTSGKIVTNGKLSDQKLEAAVMKVEPRGMSQVTIGSDEAGKGEWLGPLVVSAVAVTPDDSRTLVSRGVMDSKLLNENEIRNLAPMIRNTCLAFRVITVPPARLNDLLVDFREEGKSLNDLLAWEHSLAIKYVLNKIARGSQKVRVVIDEFDKLKTERRLWRVIDREDVDVSQHPRAEAEPAVAAASILAREERERWIDERSRVFGRDLRNLSSSEVLLDPYAYSFAKVSFIKHGRTGRIAEEDAMFQNASTVEHLVRDLAERMRVPPLQRSTLDLLKDLENRQLVTPVVVDSIRQIMNVRNDLANNESMNHEDLKAAITLSSSLITRLRSLHRESEKGKR